MDVLTLMSDPGLMTNHNQTIVRTPEVGLTLNHDQTLCRPTPGIQLQHNKTVRTSR
jgi:hypothetical protein